MQYVKRGGAPISEIKKTRASSRMAGLDKQHGIENEAWNTSIKTGVDKLINYFREQHGKYHLLHRPRCKETSR